MVVHLPSVCAKRSSAPKNTCQARRTCDRCNSTSCDQRPRNIPNRCWTTRRWMRFSSSWASSSRRWSRATAWCPPSWPPPLRPSASQVRHRCYHAAIACSSVSMFAWCKLLHFVGRHDNGVKYLWQRFVHVVALNRSNVEGHGQLHLSAPFHLRARCSGQALPVNMHSTMGPSAGLVDMHMAAMTSALAASPRAHLRSASYSPLRASAGRRSRHR